MPISTEDQQQESKDEGATSTKLAPIWPTRFLPIMLTQPRKTKHRPNCLDTPFPRRQLRPGFEQKALLEGVYHQISNLNTSRASLKPLIEASNRKHIGTEVTWRKGR